MQPGNNPFVPPSDSQSLFSIRDILLKQNAFLTDIVSRNSQTISVLQNMLHSYEGVPTVSDETLIVNPFIPDPLTESAFKHVGKLKLTRSFPRVLCKSKYFRFTVELKLGPGAELFKTDRVELTVSVFTTDRVPQRLMFTMQGKEILRGERTSILAFDLVENKHLAHYKLQILDVSSHFAGGDLHLVVEAKQSLADRGVYIRPLIIRNLKVKAKEERKTSN
jgi:hypothetical protein